MKPKFYPLLVALFCLLGTGSFAQNLIVRGGLNLSNQLIKEGGQTVSDDLKLNPGFHIAILGEFPISEAFAFETGVMFQNKGFKLHEEDLWGMDFKFRVNPWYLDIPATFRATHDITESTGLFATAGPYLGIGVGGKIKATASYGGETESDSEKIDWGKDEMYKRLDYGLIFGAGIEHKNFIFMYSYDLGLANIAGDIDESVTVKNRVMRFSFGYRIPKK